MTNVFSQTIVAANELFDVDLCSKVDGRVFVFYVFACLGQVCEFGCRQCRSGDG